MKLAGVCIQIDNRYDAVRKQFDAFLSDENEPPAFCVAVTEEECRRESVVPAYGEGICLCRKISESLLEKGVLMLHAAAVEKDGAGYLFLGKSGAGKTTHIRLWQKAFGDTVRVINGDKPLLGFEEDKLMVYSSPWQGKERLGCNGKAPVKALCFLEKAEENRLVPMQAEQALERIFHQVLMPLQAEKMERLLALVEKLLMCVPCYLLYCRPDEQAAQVALEGWRKVPGC